MATQGLITITVRGKVRAKIITGADGYNVTELAHGLLMAPTLDKLELMKRAKQFGLGGPSLCVMVSPTDYLFDEDEPDEIPPLYAEKFDVVGFNPRWHHGTAAYNETVEFHDEPKVRKFPAFRDPPPLGERWFEEDSDEAYERARDRETREEEP